MKSDWVRLYARGFYLGSNAVDFLEELAHYQRHDLPGAFFYVDEIAGTQVARQGDDWLVTIGKLLPLSTGTIAANTHSIAEALFELLQRGGMAAVETALYDLGGRHAVLIRSGGELYAYNDAAGHRTVYFDHSQQRIASHFDMLHRLTDIDELVCSVGSKKPQVSPDGMWDLTENPHIRALLPNHRLGLGAGKQTRFGLKNPNPYWTLRWADRIELIGQLWHEQLEQVLSLSPNTPVGVSLSGGLDSRTVLAHLRPHLHRVRAFSYTTPQAVSGEKPRSFWQRTMVTDHNVLQQMQDLLPEDFRFLIKPTDLTLSEDDQNTFERNAMRNHGRGFVPLYKQLFPNLNSIHIRGNFVEMGRLIRGRLDISDKKARFAEVQKEVIRRRKPTPKLYRRLFWEKFEEFEYDLLHEDVEYTDAYHWENRSARWYAEVANETDTVFDSIVPVNVRRIYDLLVSQPIEVRPGAQLQYDLIHHAWPELLAYGINTETDLYSATLRNELRENLS